MRKRHFTGRAATVNSTVLKMDGVNHAFRTGGASSFYNFGYNSFGIALSVIPYFGSGSVSRLFYKTSGSTTNAYNGYSCAVVSNYIQFQIATTGGGRWTIRTGNISAIWKRGLINRFIIQRSSTDLASAQNLANYKMILNGQSLTFTLVENTTNPTMDNANKLFFGAASVDGSDVIEVTPFQGYFDDAAIRNAAFTDSESALFMNFGITPSAGMKTKYPITEKYGKVVDDITSVSNNADLINYTDAETGNISPSTNRVYIDTNKQIYVDNFTARSYAFTANETITRIARGFTSSLTATATHKRAGVTLNTYPLNFATDNVNTVNIAGQPGDVLEFAINTLSGVGFLELLT